MAQMASSPSDDGIYDSERDETSLPTSGAETPSGPEETPEEREARLEELREELEKVEGEINMLRQVLGSKVRHATELKRKIGITPFQEFKHDLQSGINQFKSSDGRTEMYQKTSGAMKAAAEKTSSAVSSVGSVMGKKFGEMKNSNTFKSFDEKVSTTYASMKDKVCDLQSCSYCDGDPQSGSHCDGHCNCVDCPKAKVTGSRSSSEIDEAFRDAQVSEGGVVTIPDHEDAKLSPEEKVPL